MKKYVIIILNIGYWAIFMLLLFVLFGLISQATSVENQEDSPKLWDWMQFMFSTTILPALICFYLNYFVVFNLFLRKRKIGAFFIALIASGIIAGTVGALSGAAPWYLGGKFYIAKMSFSSAAMIILLLGFVALLSGIIGLVMRGFITWYSDIRVKEALTARNTEMELTLVKSQINPHFLFNTINNIDVLINKDPAQASRYLNELSDLMRFMLYETKTDRVPYTREVAYIEKYIGLHRIRNSNPDYVHFTLEGSAANLMIPPMLFIPFIENAFKHVGDKKRTPAIDIRLKADAKQLLFTCSNHYYSFPDASKTNTDGGLGNGLIQRRLELLFPNRHTLSVQTENNIYTVILKIVL